MSADDADRGVPNAPSPDVEVLRLQLQANERLVLAALRALAEVDEVNAALRREQGAVAELSEKEEELRATSEFRERLMGIIGHDLRTPLSAIVLSGEIMMKKGTLSEEDALLTKRILRSGDRMGRMVEGLVTFARVRLGGGFAVRCAPQDLGAICRQVVDELEVSSGATFRQSTEGDVAGWWDGDLLTQAIANIAGNAAEHATPGEPVLIATRGEGAMVMTEIINDGEPIPADVLPVVFDAFRRGEPSRRTNTGHLGLGLYIAYEVVRAHGGFLEVRSAGSTTCFSLRLPRVTS